MQIILFCRCPIINREGLCMQTFVKRLLLSYKVGLVDTFYLLKRCSVLWVTLSIWYTCKQELCISTEASEKENQCQEALHWTFPIRKLDVLTQSWCKVINKTTNMMKKCVREGVYDSTDMERESTVDHHAVIQPVLTRGGTWTSITVCDLKHTISHQATKQHQVLH